MKVTKYSAPLRAFVDIGPQNGITERKNRTIVEAARAMLYDQEMPKFLWAEACSTTVYVQNRTPHSTLGKITLESVFTGKTPEVSHFRIFGSLAYCRIPEEKREIRSNC